MSKSLGNVLSVPAITAHTRPIALRYYLLSVHYRSSIEYSEEALEDAATAFQRIEGFLSRVGERVGPVTLGELPDAFVAAMDDDLGVPKALAVVHDQVRAGNAALDSRDHRTAASEAATIRAMLAVLGLDPFAAPWVGMGNDDSLHGATDKLISALLAERAAARAAKNFARADEIRRSLAQAGFGIDDTVDGPVWSVNSR
jgi:cysteinyl-tRNA synthetase